MTQLRWITSRRAFGLGLLVGMMVGLGAAQLIMRREPDLVLRVEPLASPTAVVVYVTGAVARPGLYTVGSEARLAEVVEQAGPLPEADLSRVQMAARLQDGQMVVVPVRASPDLGHARGDAAGSSTEPTVSAEQLIDINRATVEDLQRLPGVGPILAQRIVSYRETHGPFQSPEQLAEVPGISPRMVDEWAGLITVGTTE
jgi:competence protein ComEA